MGVPQKRWMVYEGNMRDNPMKNHMDDGNRGTPMTEIDAWCLTDPVKKGPRADNCEKFAYRSTALYISWI